MAIAVGASLSNGVNANQVFNWRRAFKRGELVESSGDSTTLLPVLMSVSPESREQERMCSFFAGGEVTSLNVYGSTGTDYALSPSFYRFSEEAKPDRDMDLRDAIQRIALEWPSYGAAAHHGGTVAARMEGEPKAGLPADARGQPALRSKAQVHRHYRLNHGRKVYPNLAAGLVLTGVDQLWRADITYVRLARSSSSWR